MPFQWNSGLAKTKIHKLKAKKMVQKHNQESRKRKKIRRNQLTFFKSNTICVLCPFFKIYIDCYAALITINASIDSRK